MTIDLYQAAVLVFVAGGFYYTTRASFKEQKKDTDGLGAELRREIADLKAEIAKDLSGIGMKVKAIDERENRRYHNVSLAIVLVAPSKDEDKITQFLKE
jgi:hypothetical protein